MICDRRIPLTRVSCERPEDVVLRTTRALRVRKTLGQISLRKIEKILLPSEEFPLCTIDHHGVLYHFKPSFFLAVCSA
jgi:hypothetical protein